MISEDELNRIKGEIKQAALDHLHAKDAKEALGHFCNDIIAATNERLFPSFQALAEDVKAYYEILKEVRYADWDEIHIQVIDSNLATFTAKFRYGFTTTENEKIDLKGIWTAVYVRENEKWKIRLRHESFSQL